MLSTYIVLHFIYHIIMKLGKLEFFSINNRSEFPNTSRRSFQTSRPPLLMKSRNTLQKHLNPLLLIRIYKS